MKNFLAESPSRIRTRKKRHLLPCTPPQEYPRREGMAGRDIGPLQLRERSNVTHVTVGDPLQVETVGVAASPGYLARGQGGFVSLKLTVNGKVVQVEVAADTPLLWVLRDHLDLKGAKFGCGVGSCGACTVLVDGHATRSCITPVSRVAGSRITTLEGLSADGSHPVQKAWDELDVPQCGYCQSGQMMSAVALLERTPHPTDAEIDIAMTGNLCRCGTYKRIREAIHRAAGSMIPALRD